MKKRSRTSDDMEIQDRKWDFKNIVKEIEFIGTSHMTWKEKKALENQKVVSLGGKTPKKQRLPLSVARVQMKKQKEREQKMLQENLVLARFGDKLGGGGTQRSVRKRKAGNRELKASEGRFRNGTLDVKDLLNHTPQDSNRSSPMIGRGKEKNQLGKKGKGKKKGGSKKRR